MNWEDWTEVCQFPIPEPKQLWINTATLVNVKVIDKRQKWRQKWVFSSPQGIYEVLSHPQPSHIIVVLVTWLCICIYIYNIKIVKSNTTYNYIYIHIQCLLDWAVASHPTFPEASQPGWQQTQHQHGCNDLNVSTMIIIIWINNNHGHWATIIIIINNHYPDDHCHEIMIFGSLLLPFLFHECSSCFDLLLWELHPPFFPENICNELCVCPRSWQVVPIIWGGAGFTLPWWYTSPWW